MNKNKLVKHLENAEKTFKEKQKENEQNEFSDRYRWPAMFCESLIKRINNGEFDDN